MQPAEAVVIHPGEGLHYANVEFLALSEHTPRFNASIVTVGPGRHGPKSHVHEDEDDSFFILDGELVFLLGDDEVLCPAGTFVLVPPGVEHTWHNRTEADVRMLNIHAPAGFDKRLLGERG